MTGFAANIIFFTRWSRLDLALAPSPTISANEGVMKAALMILAV
jgi:hypothetical protein